MEFYSIFKFRGTYGVNKLTPMDMVGVELASVCIYIFLASLFALISPTLLFGFYILWMITGDGGQGYDGQNVAQRLYVNIFTVVAVIYYMLDFHFGWFCFKIMGSAISKESLDAVASFNVTIGIISTILFFVGHELYRIGGTWIARVILFGVVVFFAFKFLLPVGDYIVSEIVTQSTDVIEARNEMR